MEWKIPLYRIYTDEEDLSVVNRVIKRGNMWAIGPEIEEFENAIKNYVGSDYCVCLNSGTSALHATLLAYGLGNNDEIIVPSFSFVSTANSVLFVNANPVFADIETQTYGLDPNLISDKITKNTKAIIPMDYAGQSCKIFDIQEITKNRNLFLIEDAAEGFGSSIKGKKTGSVADSAIFSFTGNKVLTTGEGGAVVTNSRTIFEKIKLLRSHGRVDSINYFDNPDNVNYVGVGYNWRMSTISAALGISQLSKLEKIIKMRNDHANYFSTKLSKHSEIEVPKSAVDNTHIYQMYTIKLPNQEIRNALHSYLKSKLIFSKVYFLPIHLTTFYREKLGTTSGMLSITEQISEQILTLPIYPNMTYEEREYLISTIDEFFENRT